MKALSLKLISAVYIFIAGSLCMCAQDYLGTTEGELTTSQSGAAVYTIPIKLTDGYSSFTPQIALTYNSQAGAGIAGVGWDLSGLSAITSVPHSRYYDGDTISGVQISKNDAYALDGNRLLLMSGTNGCTGAEYDTEEKSYSKIYIEDEFTNTPKTFVVKRANGTTYKYGSTNNGVMRFPTSTSDNAFTWYLDYVEDKHGNYVKYIYNYFNNIPYLTEIRYGGNVRNANTSYCSVLFEYENKQDKQTINFKGVNIIHDKRLKKITCKYYGETYREFTLTYDNSSYYSHLISVKESGTDGKSFPETTFEWNNLPNSDQLFNDYNNSRQVSLDVTNLIDDPEYTFFTSRDIDDDGKSELIGLTPHSEGYSHLRIYDYKSSGHFNLRKEYNLSGDFELFKPNFRNNLFNHLTGYFGYMSFSSIVVPEYMSSDNSNIVKFVLPLDNFIIYGNLRYTQEIPLYFVKDIDKDGKDEIIYIEKTSWIETAIWGLYINIIDEIDIHNKTYNTHSVFIPIHYNNFGDIKSSIINDFDGDGLNDILILCEHKSIVLWSNNGIFHEYDVLDNIKYGDTVQQADINGDGMVDLMINETNSCVWKKAINTGHRGSSLFDVQNIESLTNLNRIRKDNDNKQYYYCIPTDVDLDGLTDFIIGSSENKRGRKILYQDWVCSSPDGTMSIKNSKLHICNNYYEFAGMPFANGIIIDDFDGDGVVERLEFSKGKENSAPYPQWLLYKYENLSESSNKIISITNGFGKKTDIIYAPYIDENDEEILLLQTHATDAYGNNIDIKYYKMTPEYSKPDRDTEYDNSYVRFVKTIDYGPGSPKSIIRGAAPRREIYANTITENNQVTTINIPFPIVSQVNVIYNNETYTNKYSYSGAIYHIEEKGFLGFNSVIVEQDGIKNKTKLDVNTSYHVPYIYETQTIDVNNDTISQNSYNYSFISESNNQYVKRLISETYDNKIDNKHGETIYSNYSQINGLPQKNVSGDPENGIETTVTTTYQDVTSDGKWLLGLPTKIEKEYKTITGFDSNDYEEDTYKTIENVQYDSNYNPKRITNIVKSGISSLTVNYKEYTYGTHGKVTKTINRPYNKIEYKTTTQNVYNNLGQLTQTVNVDGQKFQYVYDKYGRLEIKSDSKNYTNLKYTYNGFGQEILKVFSSQRYEFNPDTVYTEYIKEGDNYAIRTSGSNIPTSIEYYDGFGRNYASGSIHFDGKEFITEKRYLNLALVEFESMPHEKGTTTNVGTTYQYDSFLRPVLITDPQGKKTSFVYHNGGKTVTEDSISTTYDYDADGRLFMKVDDRDNRIFYSYKASKEYDKITINYEGNTEDTKVVTFEYDDYGRLLKRTNANNNVERYEYDEIGRVKSVSRDGKTESYTYNLYGNVTSKTNKGQGPYSDVTTEYTYNSNQKLIKSQNPHKISTFKYNRHGDLVSTCDTIIDNKYTGRTYSIKTDYLYNNRNQLETKEIRISGVNNILRENYSYNNGLLTSVMFNNKLMHQLEQEDVFGREIQNSDELFTNKYTYNNNGQLLTNKKYYRNNGNNTALAFQHLYEYNDLGLLIQKDNNIYEYDSYNRLSRYNNQTYSYDDKGNLTIDGAQGNINYNNYQIQSVSSPNPDVWGTSELTILNNGYNQPYMIAQDRAMMILDYDCDWNRYVLAKYSDVTPTDYLNYCNDISVPQKAYDYARIYCNSQYEIYDDHTNSLTHFYYIGGDPLSAYAVAKVKNDEIAIMYLYRDAQGSITEIVDSTYFIKHIQYTPWGGVCDENGVPYPNGYSNNDDFIRGFLGQEYYSEFGLVNLNARLYNPYTGRFLSPDPVFDPEGNAYGFNPYIYGFNNPCKFVDADGKFPWVYVAAFVIGGLWDLYTHRGETDTVGKIVAHYFVGGVSGLLSVALYKYGFKYGVRLLGNKFLSVLYSGFMSGAIASPLATYIDALIDGKRVDNIDFLNNAISAGVTSAAFSVVTHGITCYNQNLNFFTGEPRVSTAVTISTPETLPASVAQDIPYQEVPHSSSSNSISFEVNTPSNNSINPIIEGTAVEAPVTPSTSVTTSSVEVAKSEIHHGIPWNNRTWTPEYRKITDKYEFNLKTEDWNNFALEGHRGRHTTQYHKWVLENLRQIDAASMGNKALFEQNYNTAIKNPLLKNPEYVRFKVEIPLTPLKK